MFFLKIVPVADFLQAVVLTLQQNVLSKNIIDIAI